VIINVFEHEREAAIALADRIRDAIRERPRLTLGLPTGRTPQATYVELRRLHEAGAVDFLKVVTFNLDEFVGVRPSDPGSFRRFMDETLFSAVNIPASQIHFLRGDAPDIDAECERYEAAITAAGGIDIQVLGLGANGHVGFNEPGETLVARTHCVTLLEQTRQDNAGLFGGDATRVPAQAVTMGIGTILQARTILLAAYGSRKAPVVAQMIEGDVTTRLPASLLQTHAKVELFLDREAASALKGK